MPEFGFMDLTRMIRQESAVLGIKISSRRTAQLAGHSLFTRALERLDAEDAARGLTDLDQHSDATARIAIQRVLRELFNLAMSEEQVAV